VDLVRRREWQRVWAVAWKDLLTERRAKAAFNATAFFAALMLLIFSFALGPDSPGFETGERSLLEYLSPGLLWVAVFFTGALAVGRSFQMEADSGGLEGLRLLPGDRKALCLGKILANLAVMLAMELLLLLFASVLYNLNPWPRLPALLGIAVLASLGFTCLGTFYAALTVNLRAREVLLPLLLFPMLIPVVLGAVKATALVLRGDPMGELGSWARLLGAFDLVFLTVCTLTFEYVIEE
jgi:heme exporter protein B